MLPVTQETIRRTTGNREHFKNLRDAYRVYRKNGGRYDMHEYLRIADQLMKFLVNLILNGDVINLPHSCGRLYIRGEMKEVQLDEEGKIKNLAVDWKTTKSMWERLPELKGKQFCYHFNEHSNGIINKLVWNHTKVYIEHSRLYQFQTSNILKKKIAELSFAGKEFQIVSEKQSN
jgi:hypothetical protein